MNVSLWYKIKPWSLFSCWMSLDISIFTVMRNNIQMNEISILSFSKLKLIVIYFFIYDESNFVFEKIYNSYFYSKLEQKRHIGVEKKYFIHLNVKIFRYIVIIIVTYLWTTKWRGARLSHLFFYEKSYFNLSSTWRHYTYVPEVPKVDNF